MSLVTPDQPVHAITASPGPEPVSHVDLEIFSKDLLHNIWELHALYGPIAAVEAGGLRLVFLFSPEFNQIVLSDTRRYHARFFAVRGPKNSSQRRLTCGLLSMNGQQHRRNRRLVKEPFGLKAIATYSATIEQLAEDQLSTWRVGDERDIAEEMRLFTLRLTSSLLFGLDDPEAAYRLGDMLAEWISLNDRLGAGALVPTTTFSDNYELLLDFAQRVEQEIRTLIGRRRAMLSSSSDVLSILVRQHHDNVGLTDEEMVGQAAVLFAAAHMTTAHSLAWTLFLVAQFPEVMKRLVGEWQSGVTEGELQSQARLAHQGHDHAETGPVSYVDCVIKESMRLLPASAYSQRINIEPVRLGPLFLPRGTGIIFTPLVTHRRPEIYDQPRSFLPERWLTLRPSPYAYHPFGAGARMCIGTSLALVILRAALRKILTRFRLQVVTGANVNAHVASTMLVPTFGVPMTVHLADGQFESTPVRGNIHEFLDLPGAARGPFDGDDAANGFECTFTPPRQPR